MNKKIAFKVERALKNAHKLEDKDSSPNRFRRTKLVRRWKCWNNVYRKWLDKVK